MRKNMKSMLLPGRVLADDVQALREVATQHDVQIGALIRAMVKLTLENPEPAIRISPDLRYVYGSLEATAEVRAAEARERADRIRQQILREVTNAGPAGLSTRQIEKLVRGNARKIRETVADLELLSKVRRVGSGRSAKVVPW